ncbi:MAG TPA: AAA family ATPase [Dyella sp.]
MFGAYDKGGFRPRLVGSAEHDASQPPLKLYPARLPDPCSIPPRQWLYGTHLIRGYVSVLVSPGGTGKSALAMAIVMELVANRSLLKNHVFSQVNGAIFNLEDPMEELDRRVAALMIHHRIGKHELDGRLFLHDGEARGLKLASLDSDGFTVAYPDEQALIEQIRENNIGIVVCDPFAESHSLEENSNPHMVKAAAAWRRVARATGCAVLLVHHVRKGDATGIDAARGAKALTDSARVGLLLTTMTAAEAEGFGIAEDDRFQYVRLDDVKRNMAPAGRARWYQLCQVPLGNGAPGYPNGDNVAAIGAWEPANVWQQASVPDLNTALDRIDSGLHNGSRYTDSRRGDTTRWAGNILIELFQVTDKQAANMLAAWLKSGVLFREDYYDKPQRKERSGLQVNPLKRPGARNE